MKKLGLFGALLMLSACASNTPSSTNAMMNWDQINGSKVAKVSNIKSLISPGVY